MVHDLTGIFAGVHLHAHLFDFTTQLLAALDVELLRHQYRRELDHVGFHAQVFQRASGFQAEQAAADYRAAFATARAGFNGVEIFDGAIDEAVGAFRAFDRRDPGVRASGENQRVVTHRAAGIGVDQLLFAVDGDGALAQQQINLMFFIVAFANQREFFGGMVREVGGKVNAVIGDAGLFTEDG